MKIWVLFFLRKTAASFSFFLLGFFLLYALLDFSLHGSKLLEAGGKTALFYYAHGFGSQLPLFLSLSFLLSLLKLFFFLARGGGFVALQMSGLSKTRLLFPLFAFGLFLSSLQLAHEEWILPRAEKKVHFLRLGHLKHKKAKKEQVHNLSLDDGSEIVYQRHEWEKQTLFDVFWLKKDGEIWHIQELDISQAPPVGRWIDRLLENESGLLEKKESRRLYQLVEMPWSPKTCLQRQVPLESRPLSALFYQAKSRASDRIGAETQLHHKLSLSLLPSLLPLFVAPFALRFGRRRPQFLLSAFFLFGLISFFTWMSGLVILGESQTLFAPLAFWGTLAFLGLWGLFQFSRWINVRKRCTTENAPKPMKSSGSSPKKSTPTSRF